MNPLSCRHRLLRIEEQSIHCARCHRRIKHSWPMDYTIHAVQESFTWHQLYQWRKTPEYKVQSDAIKRAKQAAKRQRRLERLKVLLN